MEERRVNINDMPKWFQGILLLTPFIGMLFIRQELDNDFYFLYTTGEYIVKHGFPHKDFLSMHSSMQIIVQQWLSTVVYYYIYWTFGKIGVLALMHLCYLSIAYLSYKISYMITENRTVSLGTVLISNTWIAMMYIVSRPQIFTYIIILLELFFLEKFIREKKNRFLAMLPLLSLILINVHAAMWVMFFVYALPYLVNALPIRIGKWKQEPCCDYRKLLVAGVFSVIPGFFNPYGTKAMFYVFSSFGVPEINELIREMQATSFKEASGKLFFFLLGIMAVVAIAKKKKYFESRFVLLFAGSLLMALMNYKSHAYFYLFAAIGFSYMIKDLQITLHLKENHKKSGQKKQRILLIGLLVIATGGMVVAAIQTPKQQELKEKSKYSVDYEGLDEIMNHIPKNNGRVVLYGNFACGQYLEFHGYHPYIDGRAELFLKANNKDYDYYKEYYNLIKGKLNCKQFLDKYRFNYIVVEKETDTCLYHYLRNDDSYQWKYQSETVNLFVK